MKATQIYWLTWTPSLLLMCFFVGYMGALTVFVPSYAVYYAHEKGMTVKTFAVIAATVVLVVLAAATMGVSYFG